MLANMCRKNITPTESPHVWNGNTIATHLKAVSAPRRRRARRSLCAAYFTPDYVWSMFPAGCGMVSSTDMYERRQQDLEEQDLRKDIIVDTSCCHLSRDPVVAPLAQLFDSVSHIHHVRGLHLVDGGGVVKERKTQKEEGQRGNPTRPAVKTWLWLMMTMRMLHQVHVFFAVVGAGGFVQSKLSPQLCFVFIYSALVCGVTTASTARLPGLVGDGDGNGNGDTERQTAALTHQVESVETIRRGYRHNHRKSQ